MSDSPAQISRFSEKVDDIPVIGYEPANRQPGTRLVILLGGLSMTKEMMEGELQDLANAGFVAVGFDPFQHGERGTEDSKQLFERVFSNFRRYMWPIIGQTTLDTLRVLDWAISALGVKSEVFIGGVSMGGDIAVTVAGIEPRVKRVAAIIATPDWMRPGMKMPQEPNIPVQPGTPDAYAQYFYNQFNPLTHLERYTHGAAITFECGAKDTNVPADAALRFQAALRDPDQPEHIRVNVIPDVGHMDYTRESTYWQNALEWFTQP